MNLFETEYLAIALLAGFIVTLFVSAITVTFDKFFTVESRVKLFVLIAALIASVLTIDFDFSNWQKLATRIIITISFSVLFFHYLGGRSIRMLFAKIKTMLPGYKEEKEENNQ